MTPQQELEESKIKQTLDFTTSTYNSSLMITMNDQDRRRFSDKINDIQEFLYTALYINAKGMV